MWRKLRELAKNGEKREMDKGSDVRAMRAGRPLMVFWRKKYGTGKEFLISWLYLHHFLGVDRGDLNASGISFRHCASRWIHDENKYIIERKPIGILMLADTPVNIYSLIPCKEMDPRLNSARNSASILIPPKSGIEPIEEFSETNLVDSGSLRNDSVPWSRGVHTDRGNMKLTLLQKAYTKESQLPSQAEQTLGQLRQGSPRATAPGILRRIIIDILYIYIYHQ